MFKWIANRTILAPTTNEIDTQGRTRHVIPFGARRLEAWSQRFPSNFENSPEIIVLKFPGMAGRAERASVHPLDLWNGISGEVWAVNPLGYGGSDGPPSLESLPAMAETFWNFVRKQFPEAKILVTGNSLGSCLALFVAARFQPDGLLLRNPPPIHQLISERRRYNWWNFGAGQLIARHFPKVLDAIENARQATSPALFVQSEHDTLVPNDFQNRIINAYSGKKIVFPIPDANHHTPIDAKHAMSYQMSLDWLKNEIASTSSQTSPQLE